MCKILNKVFIMFRKDSLVFYFYEICNLFEVQNRNIHLSTGDVRADQINVF